MQFVKLKWVQSLSSKCTHHSKICTRFEMVLNFGLFTQKNQVQKVLAYFVVRNKSVLKGLEQKCKENSTPLLFLAVDRNILQSTKKKYRVNALQNTRVQVTSSAPEEKQRFDTIVSDLFFFA